MRKIILFLSLLVAGTTFAQTYSNPQPSLFGIKYIRAKSDSFQHVPRLSALVVDRDTTPYAIVYHDSAWFRINGVWTNVMRSAARADYDTAYARSLQSLGFSNGVLSAILRSGQSIDVLLDGRYTKISDTAAMLNAYPNYTATNAMLALKKDVADSGFANGYTTRARTKQIIDSIKFSSDSNYIINQKGTNLTYLNGKFKINDTAWAKVLRSDYEIFGTLKVQHQPFITGLGMLDTTLTISGAGLSINTNNFYSTSPNFAHGKIDINGTTDAILTLKSSDSLSIYLAGAASDSRLYANNPFKIYARQSTPSVIFNTDYTVDFYNNLTAKRYWVNSDTGRIIVGNLDKSKFSTNPNFIAAKTITDANNPSNSSHAFADNNNVQVSTYSYNSFDASMTYNGSSALKDHYAGFQVAIQTLDSMTFSNLYGLNFSPHISNSYVSNLYGLYFGPQAGRVGNKYVVYSADSDAGMEVGGTIKNRNGDLDIKQVGTFRGANGLFLPNMYTQSASTTDSILVKSTSNGQFKLIPQISVGYGLSKTGGVISSDTTLLSTKANVTASLIGYAHDALVVKYADTASINANYVRTANYGISKTAQAFGVDTALIIPYTDTLSFYGMASKTNLRSLTLDNVLGAGASSSKTMTLLDLTMNGTLNSFNASNAMWVNNAASTSRKYFQLTSTGANMQWGLSSSTGTGFITGASNYSSVVMTGNATDLILGTNNIDRVHLFSGGNTVVGGGIDSLKNRKLQVKGTAYADSVIGKIVSVLGGLPNQIMVADGSVTTTPSIKHIIGNSTTPTISVNGVSGTSASIAGTDLAGEITFTTSNSSIASGTILTVTFNTAYGATPYVVFSPSNDKAPNATPYLYVTNITTTTFDLAFNSSYIQVGTTYKWTYHVIQ